MYAEYLRLLRFRVIGIGAARPPYRQAATADLVVTGIRVPGPYDGVELIRQLREATDTRRMPVIVLTACAFESDQLHAQQAGCDLFLSCRNPACLTRWLVPFAASSCCVPPGASVSCARSRPCGRRKIRRSGRYSRGALLNCAFTVWHARRRPGRWSSRVRRCRRAVQSGPVLRHRDGRAGNGHRAASGSAGIPLHLEQHRSVTPAARTGGGADPRHRAYRRPVVRDPGWDRVPLTFWAMRRCTRPPLARFPRAVC